jgi:hypothetical protein
MWSDSSKKRGKSVLLESRKLTIALSNALISFPPGSINCFPLCFPGHISDPRHSISKPSIICNMLCLKRAVKSKIFHVLCFLQPCLYIYKPKSKEPRAVSRDLWLWTLARRGVAGVTWRARRSSSLIRSPAGGELFYASTRYPESPPYIDFSFSLVACGLFDRPRPECWIMDPFFSPF